MPQLPGRSALRIFTATLALTTGPTLAALPARAQDVCANRAALLDSLANDYQETPAAMGMSNGGNVIEVFTARDGKTWTILITHPDGNSCIVAAGQLWTPMPQELSSTDDTI